MVREITVHNLDKKIKNKERFILLDVRFDYENKTAKLDNSVLIPLPELAARLNELEKKKEIVVYCHHGNRSYVAADFLGKNGFKACSLKGGINEWSLKIDKKVPRY